MLELICLCSFQCEWSHQLQLHQLKMGHFWSLVILLTPFTGYADQFRWVFGFWYDPYHSCDLWMLCTSWKLSGSFLLPESELWRWLNLLCPCSVQVKEPCLWVLTDSSCYTWFLHCFEIASWQILDGSQMSSSSVVGFGSFLLKYPSYSTLTST